MYSTNHQTHTSPLMKTNPTSADTNRDSGLDSPGSSPTSTTSNKRVKQHNYVSMITKAILSSPEQKMILADIYQYIMDNFPEYPQQHRAWRNNVRYNLSQNQCFVKADRAESGKGHYWTIHTGCLEEFSRGNYSKLSTRRRVRRRARHSCHPYSYRDPASYVPMCGSSSSAAVMYEPRLSPVQPSVSPVSYTSSPPGVSGLYQAWATQPHQQQQQQQQTWDGSRYQFQQHEFWAAQYQHHPELQQLYHSSYPVYGHSSISDVLSQANFL